MFHRVVVRSDETERKIEVDGRPINATKLEAHFEVGCYPLTDITLASEPDLEYVSLVTYDFSPKTVKCAVEVLKAALQKNDFIAFMGMSDLNKIMGEKK